MGCSLQCMLFYGIVIGKEYPEIAGFDEYHFVNSDWEKENGPTEPKGSKNGYQGEEWDAWRLALSNHEASVRHVLIDWGGTENDDSFCVHCPSLAWYADGADMVRIDKLDEHPDADEQIAKFCAKYGLKFEKPAWHLSATYF